MEISLSAPDTEDSEIEDHQTRAGCMSKVKNSETEPNEETAQMETSYDRLAPYFRSYSQTRAAYLSAVDRIILQRISPHARSLLDVGAGDGVRATRLASAHTLSRLVLSDPSEEMAARCRRQPATGWRGFRQSAQQQRKSDPPHDRKEHPRDDRRRALVSRGGHSGQ